MARLALIFGSLLVLLGVIGYALQEGVKSPTAFIPAGFGLLLILAGTIATAKPSLNKHMMHVAALVGLLGTAGGLGMSLPKILKGAELARPLATYSQVTMGVICLVFVILCVRSFIAARKARSI